MDIPRLLIPNDEEKARSTASASVPTTPVASTTESQPSESPVKWRSKWSLQEEETVIRLKEEEYWKWEDIGKELPGRTATSCRLHYQQYNFKKNLDEARKNELARLYERLKYQIWAPIAEEMSIPWTEVEAMHWQLGQQEMAQRASDTLTSTSHTTTPRSRRRPSSDAPRVQRESAPRASRPATPRLTSVGELTAGLSAYTGHPSPYHLHQSDFDYCHGQEAQRE